MENIPNQETGLAPAIAGRQRVPCTGSRRGREQEGKGSGPGFPTAPASLRPRRSTASLAAALSPAAAELMARERSSMGTVRAAGACPHIRARSRACTCSAPTYRGYPAPWALLRLQGAAGSCRATATAPHPLGSWKETLQQGGAALFHPAIAVLLLEEKDAISIAFKCT